MRFDIELSTLINVILENNGGENLENINFVIDDYIFVESDEEQNIYESDLAYLYGVLDKIYVFDSLLYY